MARQKKREEQKAGAPAWMATFGDMMSLLLTFFILLVSFSSIQESKFQEAVSSLQGALGVLKDMPTVAVNEEILRNRQSQSADEDLTMRVNKFRRELEALKKSDNVEISRSEKGLAIRLDAEALFDLGKAEIRSEAHPILDQLVEAVQSFPNEVRIEGHTDDLPISNKIFPSNWELSAARAASVLRYLERSGIDPRRLSAVGMGEWRPMVKNDSPTHRQRNRRVEVFMDVRPDQRRMRLGEHL